MSTIASFFETVKLPTAAAAALALAQKLSDGNAPLSQVRRMVMRDPSLCAKLLRLANTAQFGLPRAVGTVGDALEIVGPQRMRSLTLAHSSGDSLSAFAELTDFDADAFWRSSMVCAGFSQWLAQSLELNGQVAWVAGMVLRLGGALIAQATPEILQEIEQLPRIPGVRWQREERLPGFTEGQITAELARHWNFPPQIVQALQYSAAPMAAQSFSRLGAIVHLAGLLAEMPQAAAHSIEQLPQDVISTLGLDVRWMYANFPARSAFLEFK